MSNPSEHQSISINGQTSNGTASNSNERSSSDILQALADASRPTKRKGNSNPRGGGNKRQRQSKPKSTTAAFLDKLLADYDSRSSEIDMSQYVMNPSEHQSISLNGRTVHNKPSSSSAISKPSTPAPTSSSASTSGIRSFLKPTSNNTNSNRSSASSVTSSSTSSIAQRVMDSNDDEIFDWNRDRLTMPSSSSKRYSTPSNSTILQADKNRKTTKPSYNVDEFNVDLSPPIIPTFTPSSSQKIQSNEIVDLLSSPEISPTLPPSVSQLDEEITFDDNFIWKRITFPCHNHKQSRSKMIHFIILTLRPMTKM